MSTCTEPLITSYSKLKDEYVVPFEEMMIPNYILNYESTPTNVAELYCPDCPVLVFINVKSGAQLGNELIPHFRSILNPKQVFELPHDKPDEILRDLLHHFQKLQYHGDKFAEVVRNRLRLVVAGGDGTHGWLLGVVADLKIRDMPPVGTIPLGTGNNLPYSFGWGKKNPLPTVNSARELLLRTAEALPMPVDRWHVVIRTSEPLSDSPLMEIHPSSSTPALSDQSMQFQSLTPIPEESEHYEEGQHSYEGSFWNYLSVGMDSQVSYAFHAMRKKHPELFKDQIMNQGFYAFFSCYQGWFCAPCCHPRSKNLKTLAKISTATYDGDWEEIHLSSEIRSIVMLNLPSFSGGKNPWGTPSDANPEERGLTSAYVNDGLIEIVGFRDGWHGTSLLIPGAHGQRIAQAHKVRIEFHEGGEDHTFLRLDGEPWLQKLPCETDPAVVEITHKGQAIVLAYGDCVAETIPTELASKIRMSQATVAPGQELQNSASKKIRQRLETLQEE